MKVYPQFDEYSDQPDLRPSVLRELDIKGAQHFVERHPEFYGSEFNASLLQGFLSANGIPASLRNLEIGLAFLTDQGVLEARPEEAPEPPADQFVERFTHRWGEDARAKSNTGGTILDEKTAAKKAAYDQDRATRRAENVVVPHEDPAQFRDKHGDNDMTRKKRDHLLKQAAQAERIANVKMRNPEVWQKHVKGDI